MKRRLHRKRQTIARERGRRRESDEKRAKIALFAEENCLATVPPGCPNKVGEALSLVCLNPESGDL